MRISFWPQGLIGRVTVVLLSAVLLELVASIVFYEHIDAYTVREDHARRVAELLVVGARLMDDADAHEQADAARVLSTRHLKVFIDDKPLRDAAQDRQDLDRMKTQVVTWEPQLAGRDLHLNTERRGQRADLVGALQLSGGRWMHFRSSDVFGRWPLLWRIVATAAILAGAVLAMSTLLLRNLGAPLKDLVTAAQTVGDGRFVPVAERGAGDVRRLAQAFNAMQARIARLFSDRTQAFAAVSHDLRTPLARMRLEAGFIQDEEIKTLLERDIDEMEAMLSSMLAYLRGEADPEKPRLTDIAAMVQTLADSAADAGQDVRYDGPDHLLCQVRPTAMKRAAANLVENAVKYGGGARLALSKAEGRIRLIVEDDGPGIPEAELEKVMEPFYRMDAARARSTAGFGLGLPIVRRMVENEGGAVTLSNRAAGGLRVEIALPDLKP